jgi:DNA-binding MarR family transcriptional regulator
VIPIEFAYGLGVGLAVAVGLYLVLWWQARRHATDDLPPAGAFGRGNGPIGMPNGVDAATRHLSPLLAPETPLLPHPSDSPTGPNRPTSVSTAPAEEPSTRPRSLPPTETLRLSQRLILHIYAQGNLPPGEVAPPGLCQSGMVDALGIPQAGLAAVIRRLEAAGILLGERGHVRGHDRRLKIYRLSSRGVEVARELRLRARSPIRR